MLLTALLLTERVPWGLRLGTHKVLQLLQALATFLALANAVAGHGRGHPPVGHRYWQSPGNIPSQSLLHCFVPIEIRYSSKRNSTLVQKNFDTQLKEFQCSSQRNLVLPSASGSAFGAQPSKMLGTNVILRFLYALWCVTNHVCKALVPPCTMTASQQVHLSY